MKNSLFALFLLLCPFSYSQTFREGEFYVNFTFTSQTLHILCDSSYAIFFYGDLNNGEVYKGKWRFTNNHLITFSDTNGGRNLKINVFNMINDSTFEVLLCWDNNLFLRDNYFQYYVPNRCDDLPKFDEKYFLRRKKNYSCN